MAKNVHWRRAKNVYWRNGHPWLKAMVNGERIREPLNATSQREAEELALQRVAELRQQKKSPSKVEIPFADAVKTFTEEHFSTLKPSSRQRYLLSLLTLVPHFEGKTLQGIGKADLMAFVSARRKDKVSSSTIRHDLACLSSVFTVANDWDLCEGNPVLPFLRAQKRRGGLKEGHPRERYLSVEEENAILRLARAKHDACEQRFGGAPVIKQTKLMILAAIAVAIDTGLRDEEQLRLRWRQVDLERDEVTVLASASKNKRERTVPLLPRAKAILASLPRHPQSDLVFWHRNGVGFYDLNHTLQRLGAEVEVTGIRWHDLRRTCGCRLLQDRGMPIELVSFWLGHSSVVQTQRTYAFLKVDQLHASIGSGLKVGTNVGTNALRESLKTVALIGDTSGEQMVS